MSEKAAFDQWRKSGEFLPEFMRDFHDQKDLFKALHEVVDRRLAADRGSLYLRDLSWIDAHVYTVDIFLWVMAGHGYTLQRTRKRWTFPSIYDFVSAANERARKAMASVLFGMAPAQPTPQQEER